MEILLREKKKFYKIGAWAAIGQLALIFAGMAVFFVLGGRPMSGQEAMELFAQSKILGLLQDEIFTVWMMFLYVFTFTALFIALFKTKPVITFFAVIFSYIAVIICVVSHSGYSLMYLSDLFKAADAAGKESIIVAADAVLARNMWNSTSSYFCGILSQGGGVLISIAMIKTKKFSLITIIGGIIGNGLDLIQHLIHHQLPGAAEIILISAGLFYFAWYIFMGVDLFKLAKR